MSVISFFQKIDIIIFYIISDNNDQYEAIKATID